jgi:putative DNA primase/helicase
MLVRLKRIAQKETIKGITRDAGSLIIAEATPECVMLEMARTARYLKWNERKRSHVETDPSVSYARALAAKNEFSFKTLLATIETPTLRPDGSVLQKGGYDEASGLFFDSGAQTFPTIDNNPSRDDAAAALREIDDVLKDFPFVDSGGAVANAAILTALVRRVLPAAPMFLFDAPVPAAGKSLLASVVGWIATGREPAGSQAHHRGADRRRFGGVVRQHLEALARRHVVQGAHAARGR